MLSKAAHKLLLLSLVAASTGAWAQQVNSLGSIESEMSSGGTAEESISVVRETTLREAAATLGAQAGLRDRSCELNKVLVSRERELDGRFRFNSLMMGKGMLPPVISEARDTVTYDRLVMRIASRAYHLDEPAYLVDVPPTWRDWIYVGLESSDCNKSYQMPEVSAQLRPQTSKERAFFSSVLKASYQAGRDLAQKSFDDNFSRLERTYQGMRRYFELFERGMVSAPVLVSDTDVVAKDDANTLVVGDTVVRILAGVTFVDKPEKWKPLAP